jgi:hypothetical protein
MKGAVLSASIADDDTTLDYFAGMDDPNFTTAQLGQVADTMKKMDRKLYATITSASKSQENNDLINNLISAGVLGGGRQALRIVDTHFKYVAENVSTQATSRVVAQKCSGITDASRYISDFKLNRVLMGNGDDKMSNSLGTELLKAALGEIDELKAVLAQYEAEGLRDLSILTARLEKTVHTRRAKQQRSKGEELSWQPAARWEETLMWPLLPLALR